MAPSLGLIRTAEKQRVVLSKLLLTPSVFSPVLRRPKIVHRHLCNGDMVVMNRQPTLHRAGIMGHVARVLKGEKTFRLHYANCKAYNADFDGDEMNAHFPQNEIARSETANLLNVQQQYLVPKDGTPLSGLIQDHIIAGVKLSLRGNFFTREEYHQMVYQGLHSKLTDIELLPPAILKPKKLWTGKQVISTVIMNSVPAGQPALNLTSQAKISDKAWIVERPRRWKAGGTGFTEHSMSEEEVIIKNGQLLCGVLDKSHFGATAYGLVHCMNELYGGKCSSNLLSAFSKVLNYFMRIHGFSFSVEDLLLRKKAEKKRHRLIQKSRQFGEQVIRSAVDLPETASLEEVNAKLDEIYENKAKGRAIVDSCYKEHLDEYTNSINKACIPSGLYQHFPDNNLQLMIQSGAKGSSVNAMQISCLLGQIELEGRRPPHMMSGKTLPSFARYDSTPRAGGFVDGRFLTGIKPQEFFFHCMAGREGLIDTAVKTSRIGYLQRCLVKHLEGVKVCYDSTVRDSDGSVLQFRYGEDGKDVTKAQFLKKKQLPFLADNSKAVLSVPVSEMNDSDTSALIAQRTKQIRKWKKKHGDPLQRERRLSAFTLFSIDVKNSIAAKKFIKLDKKTRRSKAVQMICDMWVNADSETLERYHEKSQPCPDPVSADFVVGRDFGALTEQLKELMKEHVGNSPRRQKKEFQKLMSIKSLLSACHPGDAVGMLAAQSIAEPSTQMTLNTFILLVAVK
ncbi:hypothetical protein L9F63_024983 [Diploptera punctata]|uniref:DNA-directed RNA polymerase I subunit RPA1 n=1 Tax=Diploptera punctata TaxID=6984 RepID=A0AAD8E5L4_DIPPU|nr:hypothetical protein L9F63_024983 [Diploptera punctata]